MKDRHYRVRSASYALQARGAQWALVEKETRNAVATRTTRAAVLQFAKLVLGISASAIEGGAE